MASSGSVTNVHTTSLSAAQARRKVADAVANAMLDAFSFDEDSTLVMDYACGSGSLSQRLAPYSKSIIGVDISADAVEQYNAKVTNQGIPLEEMHAICVELKEQPDELEGKQFDVIGCSQAYHHFPSISETTLLLTTFLKPGTGILLVSDIVKGPGGLTESEVRESFEQAGLLSIDFEVVETVKRDGREVEIFLAQGIRPAEDT